MTKAIRKDLPRFKEKISTPHVSYQSEVMQAIRETWEELRKVYPTLTLPQVNMIFTSQWRLTEEMLRRFDLYDEATWETIKLPALGKFWVSKYKVEKHRKQIEMYKERDKVDGTE